MKGFGPVIVRSPSENEKAPLSFIQPLLLNMYAHSGGVSVVGGVRAYIPILGVCVLLWWLGSIHAYAHSGGVCSMVGSTPA